MRGQRSNNCSIVLELLLDGKCSVWTFSVSDFPPLCLRHLSLGGSRPVLLVRRSGMLEGEFAQSTSHVQSYDSIADITIKLLTRRGRSR